MSAIGWCRRGPASSTVLALAALFVLATSGCDTKSTYIVPVVTGLRLEVVGPGVRLTWSRAPDITRVRLVRRLNAPPETPHDTLAILVFEGTANAAIDNLTLLLPSTTTDARTYHYAVFPCPPGGACAETPSRAELTPTLVQCLRGGGYTLWWRHASADLCADRLDLGRAATTSAPNWWKSCDPSCPPAGSATARQLNATGVMEATAIGQAFDALGIPIGRVISSEYCRCLHSAELNDFGPTIEQDSTITFFVYDEANRCAHSMARVATVPSRGTNTAIIGHAGFSGICPTLGDLAWGEAAVYKPKGDGTAELVTRLFWNEWTGLP